MGYCAYLHVMESSLFFFSKTSSVTWTWLRSPTLVESPQRPTPSITTVLRSIVRRNYLNYTTSVQPCLMTQTLAVHYVLYVPVQIRWPGRLSIFEIGHSCSQIWANFLMTITICVSNWWENYWKKNLSPFFHMCIFFVHFGLKYRLALICMSLNKKSIGWLVLQRFKQCCLVPRIT